MSRRYAGKNFKKKMRCIISQDESFKFLEWIFFIMFIIVAGLFSSGVLQQYFSQKTSFSQTEGEMKNYPVLSMVFYGEVNLTNIMFFYGRKMQLKIGKN